ncbi:MAG: tetratricopeptide repeat protein [Acidimicrobiales bacterium]
MSRRGRTRPFLIAVGTVAAAVVVALLLTNSTSEHDADPTSTTRDLSQVSNDEMEAVIADNPDVVPMRLALVERYLDDGEIARAHAHAQEALARSTAPANRARSLRYVGWTLALLGNPAEGEEFLRESLALEPGHDDSLWFLARVLFEGEARPADAIPLLEEVLASDVLSDAQRPQVEAKLDEARAAVDGAPNPTLPTLPSS